MFRSVVSNEENFTAPLEDISPKQRHSFFYFFYIYIENATKDSTGWFPYDRRRSRIADDLPKELFPYNRRRSQAIAELIVGYISDTGSVKITRALCWRENRSRLQSIQITAIRSSYAPEK